MPEFEQEQSYRLLLLLQQLLEIETPDLYEALKQAALLIAQALPAEKADVFLYEAENQTLVAQGISDTPLGHLQQSVGLHRIALANGGRAVSVFQTGQTHYSGHIDQDPDELPGIKHVLGVRSAIAVPLEIGGERRGVIQVDSTQNDAFTQQDQRFLEAVSHWVGTIAHRAELMQQVTRSAAEEARRLRAEELMTILAHDLRNDLTPVKGRLHLLNRRAAREHKQQDLQDLAGILHSLRRFEQLITDIMDTARLSQGLFTLNYQTVNLSLLAQEAAATIQTPSNQIEIQMPDELVIQADVERLRQALENILSNAITHSPPDKNVVVQAEFQKNGTQITLSVTDYGDGIPSNILPHLFEPFRAGEGSRGLGLGLYLAHQIIIAHGGTIEVDTTWQQGTRFVLSLPNIMDDHTYPDGLDQ